MNRFGWFFVLIAVLLGLIPFAASKSVADSGNIYISVMLADGICEMDIEEYTLRVLIAEGHKCENAETKKALAVATRSCGMYFALYGMKHENYDVCTDKNCCLPLGDPKNAEGRYLAELAAAASETKGVILTLDELPAMSLFTLCASRGTRYCKEFEYLVPIENPEKCNKHITELVFSIEEYSTVLQAPQGADSCLVYCENEKCEFGVFGNKMLSANELVAAFSLPSYEFTLDISENEAKFTCYGAGNGIGLDLCAADKLAATGYGYENLLMIFYPNLEINKIYNA